MSENPIKKYKPSNSHNKSIPFTEPLQIDPIFSKIIRPTMFGIPDIIWDRRWTEDMRQRWKKMHHSRQTAMALCKQNGIIYNEEQEELKHNQFIATICKMWLNEFDEIDNFN